MELVLYIDQKQVRSWPLKLENDRLKSFKHNVEVRKSLVDEAILKAKSETEDIRKDYKWALVLEISSKIESNFVTKNNVCLK